MHQESWTHQLEPLKTRYDCYISVYGAHQSTPIASEVEALSAVKNSDLYLRSAYGQFFVLQPQMPYPSFALRGPRNLLKMVDAR